MIFRIQTLTLEILILEFEKLQEGECDAIVLAAAGLKRIRYLVSHFFEFRILDPQHLFLQFRKGH